jgi:antitoxin component YwqK of YwqJK toxin-antitoxin module
MKKRILIIICLLVSLVLYAEEKEFYRSNALGMTLEKIPEYRRDEFSFVLSVEDGESGELRRLFRDGRQIKEYIRSYSPSGLLLEEQTSEDGILRKIRRFSERGIREELRYENGELKERIEYIYEDGVLQNRKTYDETGALSAHFEYHYLADGRLEYVRQLMLEEKAKEIRFHYDGEGIYAQWEGGSGEGELVRYNDAGRILSREGYRGDELIYRERYEYAGSDAISSKIRKIIFEDFQKQDKIIRVYNDNEQLAEERLYHRGELVSETTSTYEEGRLRSRMRRSGALLEEWIFDFSADRMVSERYLRNGEIEYTIAYGGSGIRIKEVYNEGEAVVRIHFEGGEKIKEEILEDGIPVRTRYFGNTEE